MTPTSKLHFLTPLGRHTLLTGVRLSIVHGKEYTSAVSDHWYRYRQRAGISKHAECHLDMTLTSNSDAGDDVGLNLNGIVKGNLNPCSSTHIYQGRIWGGGGGVPGFRKPPPYPMHVPSLKETKQKNSPLTPPGGLCGPLDPRRKPPPMIDLVRPCIRLTNS